MSAITASFTGTFGSDSTTYNLPNPISVYSIQTTYAGETPDNQTNFGRVDLYLNGKIVYANFIDSGTQTHYPGGYIADRIDITVARQTGTSGTTTATADILQEYEKLFSLSTDYGILANGAGSLSNIFIEDTVVTDKIKSTFGATTVIETGLNFEVYTGGITNVEALQVSGIGNLQIRGNTLTLAYNSTGADSQINFSNAAQASLLYDYSEDTVFVDNADFRVASGNFNYLNDEQVTTFYIKRIWSAPETSFTWTLRYNAGTGAGELVTENTATFTSIALGYTPGTTDKFMVEFSANSSNSLEKGIVMVGSGTFSSTNGMALLSYDAYNGVSSNGTVRVAKYVAQ